MEFTLRFNVIAVKEDPDLAKFEEAMQKMIDRMSVSHFKYGNMRDKYPHSARPIDTAEHRMEKYDGKVRTTPRYSKDKGDGNREHLLDAANFLIIEYLFPSHPEAHFEATDSNRSPGLVYRED